MDSPRFIYITDQFYETVKDSQVINWLELLGQNGIIFDLFVITPLPYLFKANNIRRKKIRKCRLLIPGRTIQVPIIMNKDKTGISEIIIFIFLIINLLFIRLRHKKILIQIRSLNLFRVVSMIKNTIPAVKIIFDCRGAAAEEYINSLQYNSIDDKIPEPIRKYYYSMLEKERILCQVANKIFCVSDRLKEYILQQVLIAPEQADNLVVIPGAADDKHFFFDLELRNATRESLNVLNKNVIIYTGKLNSHWHKKDTIFKLMASLIRTRQKCFFLCLTPDLSTAGTLKIRYGIPDENITIQYIDYDNINPCLCAADFGLILRENILTNNVSSPTKIPEYLLCGLPVLISPHVGDYSKFIFKNKLGLLIPDDIPEASEIILDILDKQTFDRNRIASLGKKLYAKQSLLDKMVGVYKSIWN